MQWTLNWPLLGIFIVGTLTSCQRSDKSEQIAHETDQYEAKVIYGDDDRREYHEVSQALQKVARSTVALVKTAKLSQTANGIQVAISNYGTARSLCASEPFREQPTAAFCSGSLVGKNLVLTAGHCIEDAGDCDSTSFVFDFRVNSGTGANTLFQNAQVYKCKRIVTQRLESSGTDYALVELDRDVDSSREPIALDRSPATQVGRSLVVIGHPSGLPTKVAGGGQVRTVTNTHLVTNLDTYGGNSGSGVFDSQSLKLVGILVRGENDFVSQGSCTVSYRCPATGCRGEDVTRLEPVLAQIPELGGGDEGGDDDNQTPVPGEKVSVTPNLAIPDFNLTGVESALVVQGEHLGKSVKVAVNIKHTWVGDLKLELTHPSGRVLLLQYRKGGRARDLVGVFGESLTSEAPLSVLQTLSKKGVWKLRVSDTLARDVGALLSWGIDVQ